MYCIQTYVDQNEDKILYLNDQKRCTRAPLNSKHKILLLQVEIVTELIFKLMVGEGDTNKR